MLGEKKIRHWSKFSAVNLIPQYQCWFPPRLLVIYYLFLAITQSTTDIRLLAIGLLGCKNSRLGLFLNTGDVAAEVANFRTSVIDTALTVMRVSFREINSFSI